MSEQIVAAIIGVLVGALLAYFKAVLVIREKVNEELRSRRLNTYPIVYRLTGTLSFWPAATLSYEELLEVNLALRVWYFTNGGLYLSANSRKRYGEMKQLICGYLDEVYGKDLRTETVPAGSYRALAVTGRAFRNALAEDLETRRQRSLWWLVVSSLNHRRQNREWERLIVEVGGAERDVRPYPLGEMPLPPIDQARIT